MRVQPIKTRRVIANDGTLHALLDEAIETLADGSIIVITSKIVSLCEGAVVDEKNVDRDTLIEQESDFYLPAQLSSYGHHFSIKDNTLIASAGIDQSNGNGEFILWPRDPWTSAKETRDYLSKKFNINHVGVIITDSTCQPMRRGTIGIALAYSGFKGLRNYIGKPDLFGRPLHVTQANVAGGLASAAVVVMGEGAESTPIAVISETSDIEFGANYPDTNEISECVISPKEDLFAPFLQAVDWLPGGMKNDPESR